MTIYDILKSKNKNEIIDVFKKSSMNIDTFLLRCVYYNFYDGVEMALNNGANIHHWGDEALCQASRLGHVNIIKLLLKNGADINANNTHDPLKWAVKENQLNVIKILLDAGANPNISTAYIAKNNYKKILELLKKYKYKNVNEFDVKMVRNEIRDIINKKMRAKLVIESFSNSVLRGKSQDEVLQTFRDLIKDSKGDLNLGGLTQLPEAVEFNNQGYVYLRSLTSMPDGVVFKNQGWVDLSSLTSMPKGVVFKNQGDVDLWNLTSMPEGVEFKNQGDVYLASLTSMPEGVVFKNKGSVNLRSLTSMPDGVEFRNQGNVWLASLTSMPEGVVFNNHGFKVYLKYREIKIK